MGEFLRLDGFRQREPGDGAPASQETVAYLGFDQSNLYVVFHCSDDPSKLRAHMAKREDFGNDDNVAIYLDTFRDQRRAYVFAVNPFGIQLDGIHTEGQGLDLSFDTLWYSDGRVTASGYVAWMSIPFKSLRFSSDDAQTWGFTLDRVIPRNNEVSFWPYVTNRDAGFANQFGILEGLQRISPGRNLQFIPYGIFTSARFLDPNIPAYGTKNEFRGGMDAKVVLQDAVTMDVALNPDFSQVESDQPQVTINQRFEVFFPEKRPFFIENAGYFRTPINLFFSRRIADPQFGLRFTGKAGPWSFGGIGIDDREPSAALAPPGSGPGPVNDCDPLDTSRAAIGVGRVQREFAGQSTAGFLASTRRAPTCSSGVFSGDTRLVLNQNWIFTGQLAGSQTHRTDGTNLTGLAAFAELGQFGRHFTSVTRYEDRSPDFRAELGFVSRVDIRQGEQYFSYYWRPKSGRLVSFGPNAFTVVNWNRAGRLQDWFVQYNWVLEFKKQTFLTLGGMEQFELFQGLDFRQHRGSVTFSTAWYTWLGMEAFFQMRSAVNYYPQAPLDPFLGKGTDGSIGVSLRPLPRFRFDQTYLYTRLGTRDGSTPPGFTPGTAIFNNHIVRSKVNYQFSKQLSLRAILDYNATLPNEQLTIFPREKRLNGDVLLTYLVNPGTALYIGYSDRTENQQLVAMGMPAINALRTTPGLAGSTGRQFFVKFSYLFRY